jgi:hypothetical protein
VNQFGIHVPGMCRIPHNASERLAR